ncbi:MAG TPA: phage tail assembly protein [Blastocatellia bacterium]|nr:phage tail assembly protein [Blastocatellia bacterium]
MLQTEFEFTLPKGYIDKNGDLHKQGIMRLANAKDEIAPLQDPRVQNNAAYLVVILLSRVITKLGKLNDINPSVVENFFSADLAYLQDFYRRINTNGNSTMKIMCPECENVFEVDESAFNEGEGLGG